MSSAEYYYKYKETKDILILWRPNLYGHDQSHSYVGL